MLLVYWHGWGAAGFAPNIIVGGYCVKEEEEACGGTVVHGWGRGEEFVVSSGLFKGDGSCWCGFCSWRWPELEEKRKGGWLSS